MILSGRNDTLTTQFAAFAAHGAPLNGSQNLTIKLDALDAKKTWAILWNVWVNAGAAG